jgi:hypothetical protein
MANDLDKILDQCVDRINRGESLADCLASYPGHAKELEPLLRSMIGAQAAYSFAPSSTTKQQARRRFNAALEELVRRREEKRALFPVLLRQSRAWVAVAAVLIVALVAYFGLRPMLFPTGPAPGPGPLPVMPGPQPGPEGNFVFLISDDVNAIGDFQSLSISVSNIGLQRGAEAGQWIEFDPEVGTVDLTLLRGDKARELWRGDVPEGQYTKVFIHVSDVSGVLEETGRPVDVKLPSERLQISKPFEVTGDSVASFVYDVTVVQAGKSGQYILKPEAGQSGVDQRFETIE